MMRRTHNDRHVTVIWHGGNSPRPPSWSMLHPACIVPLNFLSTRRPLRRKSHRFPPTPRSTRRASVSNLGLRALANVLLDLAGKKEYGRWRRRWRSTPNLLPSGLLTVRHNTVFVHFRPLYHCASQGSRRSTTAVRRNLCCGPTPLSCRRAGSRR